MASMKVKAKGKSLVPTKPKRPLSAFNLFYRFKRQKVLDAISSRDNGNGKIGKDDISRLIEAPPGLEEDQDTKTKNATDEADDDDDASPSSPKTENDLRLRRATIRNELQDNLLPRESRDRSHRTNQGALNGIMSFVELGSIVSSSWKNIDDFAKTVFMELAEEGRELYRWRMGEYKDNDDGNSTKACVKKTAASTKKAKKGGAAKKKDYIADHDDSEDSEELETAEIMINLNHNKSIKSEDTPKGGNGHIRGGAAVVKSNNHPRDEIDESKVSHQEEDVENPNQPKQHQNEDEEERLRSRVRELEGQLTQQRLRSRVQELEEELEFRRNNETRLREVLLSRYATMMASQRGGNVGAPPLGGALVNNVHNMQHHGLGNLQGVLGNIMAHQNGMIHNNGGPFMQHNNMGNNNNIPPPNILNNAQGQMRPPVQQQSHVADSSASNHRHRPPSPRRSRSNSPESLDHDSNKKQKHG